MKPKHIAPEKLKDVLLLQDIHDVKVTISDGLFQGFILDLSNGQEIEFQSFPDSHSEIIVWDITKPIEVD